MQVVLELLRTRPYLRGFTEFVPLYPLKCLPKKISTLFQHISAVAAVNIVTI